jgi:hypothetical protein
LSGARSGPPLGYSPATSRRDLLPGSVNADDPNLRSITIYGPDSKELKPRLGAWSKSPGTFEGGRYLQFVSVPKIAGKVTVRMTFFNKVEDVPIPIDLTVGLGL